MDLTGLSGYQTAVAVAVVLGPVGCLVSLGYVVRVDYRDNWRRPMLVTAVLGGIAIIVAYLTGERALAGEPDLADTAEFGGHLDYGLTLLLPTAAWLATALLTGWVNPRNGPLKLALPAFLAVLSALVLGLLVLYGDPGVRAVWDLIVSDLDR